LRRGIRSRATANAIVARLRTRADLVARALGRASSARSGRGRRPPRSCREPADAQSHRGQRAALLFDIDLDHRRRSGTGRQFANAVALEYLRGRMLPQLADTQAAADRELTQLSSVYGVRHPSYVLARTRLDTLQNRLTALRDGPPDDDTVRLVIGQSFVAAEKTFVPSGPPIILILGLTAGAALGVGIWLAAGRAERSDGILHLSASTIAAIDPQAILESAPQRSSRRRAKFGSLGTILANHSAYSRAAQMSPTARLTLIAASRLSRSSGMSRQAPL
jgi:hypothetical protein